tara:strand:- start:261 stop:740 length:480 start_codon:yes stop_codon:yes gene_type:complete
MIGVDPMDTKASIQKLIQISMQKLHIMKEKSQLIEDETYFTDSQSTTEIGAIDQIRGVLEEKLLTLDIEFLKFYGNVLDREGISKLSEIDTAEHPSLADLQTTVTKIKELESSIESSQSSLNELRREHQKTLGDKLRIQKQGGQISHAYQKQMSSVKTK